MSAIELAERSTDAIMAVPAHPMGAAIGRADDVGLSGNEFYVAGRCGAMGDVEPAVAAAALMFMHPDWVRAQYHAAATVLPPPEASARWAALLYEWAERAMPAEPWLQRFSELTGRCTSEASDVGAPIFAAWRQLAEPAAAPALAIHRLYLLRELRAGLHAGALLAAGLLPVEALLIRTPAFAANWGWPEPYPDVSGLVERWRSAEAATNVAMSRVFDPLTEAERDELGELMAALLEHVGMPWWFDGQTPTVHYGPRPTATD